MATRVQRACAEIAPPAKARHRRPLAHLIHSLLGVKLSLFLGFICLTGTIATVSHEIEWLAMPQVRATPVEGQEDWGAIWDAVRAAYPGAWIEGIGSYDRNDEPYFVRTASVVLGSGERIDVHVDPSTAQVTGEVRGPPFHSIMRGLHYYLLAPGRWPFYLVSSLGFVLLVSLVTGLMAYKKFWRGLWKRPRLDRNLRTASGDLHRLVGLWSVPFTFVIAVTSIWYFFEFAGVDFNSSPPEVQARPADAAVPTGEEVAAWVAAARGRMPDLKVNAVTLPYGAGEPVTVQGQAAAWLVRERTNAVYIDRADGRIAGVRRAEALGAGERWVHTADPLHFGNFAGLLSKLLWVIFGLMLTAMSLTGAIIFAKRTAGAAVALAPRRA